MSNGTDIQAEQLRALTEAMKAVYTPNAQRHLDQVLQRNMTPDTPIDGALQAQIIAEMQRRGHVQNVDRDSLAYENAYNMFR